MAQKNGNGQQTAGQRLQALRGQIGALLARKQELGASDRPDVENPAEWVKQRGKAAGELQAIDMMLPSLEAEARAAEAQLAEARKAEMAAAAQAAREEIPAKLADVIKAADGLDVALQALEGQERVIAGLGGWAPATGCYGLRQALGRARGEWRKAWPELLGLPAAPSRGEQLLAEARADLARAEVMLRDAERMDEGPRGELSSDKKRLIGNYAYGVAVAKQRVRDAEHYAKHGKPAPAAKPEQAAEVITVDVSPGPERKQHSGGAMRGHWEE